MILTKKSSRSLKLGYMSNFLLMIAMQFQQIIALPSHAQISVCGMSCTGNGTSSEELRNIENSYNNIPGIRYI